MAGGVSPAVLGVFHLPWGCRPLSLLAGGGIVLGSLKLGASLFPAPSSRLGSGTRGHALAGPVGLGLVLVVVKGSPARGGSAPGWRWGGVPVCSPQAASSWGLQRPSPRGWSGSCFPACCHPALPAPRITLMGMGMEGGPDPCRISPSWGRSGLPSALHLPVAMAAGGSILPVCRVGGRPERPLPPGALTGCRRGSGFLCCHRGMGTSPMSRPPACHSSLPRAPWERDRTPSMTHTMAWGRRVSLFPSRLQPVPAGALQFGEVVRIVGKIQMPQSGYK